MVEPAVRDIKPGIQYKWSAPCLPPVREGPVRESNVVEGDIPIVIDVRRPLRRNIRRGYDGRMPPYASAATTSTAATVAPAAPATTTAGAPPAAFRAPATSSSAAAARTATSAPVTATTTTTTTTAPETARDSVRTWDSWAEDSEYLQEMYSTQATGVDWRRHTGRPRSVGGLIIPQKSKRKNIFLSVSARVASGVRKMF